MRLFEVAEIANFSIVEQDAYEDSLKYYRDLNNVVDTSRQEGKQEGLEEGRELATTNLVIRQLTKRFGNLFEDNLKAIQALTIEASKALGEALLDFTTLEDLENWLNHYSE